MKHPIQPLACDSANVLRFKKNKIVCHLLDISSTNLNDLAKLDFSDDDRTQFIQLIGYDLSGFGNLSYVDKATYELAEIMSKLDISEENMASKDTTYVRVIRNMRRIETNYFILSAELTQIKKGLKIAALAAFDIHPDDLGE